jgi:hypothetical protein
MIGRVMFVLHVISAASKVNVDTAEMAQRGGRSSRWAFVRTKLREKPP